MSNPIFSALSTDYAVKAALAADFIHTLTALASKHGTRVNEHTIIVADVIANTPRFVEECDAILTVQSDRAVITVVEWQVKDHGSVLATVVFDCIGIHTNVNPHTRVNPDELIQTIDEWTAHEVEFCETDLAESVNATEFLQNIVGGYLSNF